MRIYVFFILMISIIDRSESPQSELLTRVIAYVMLYDGSDEINTHTHAHTHNRHCHMISTCVPTRRRLTDSSMKRTCGAWYLG